MDGEEGIGREEVEVESLEGVGGVGVVDSVAVD